MLTVVIIAAVVSCLISYPLISLLSGLDKTVSKRQRKFLKFQALIPGYNIVLCFGVFAGALFYYNNQELLDRWLRINEAKKDSKKIDSQVTTL